MPSKEMSEKAMQQILNLLQFLEAKYKIVLPDGAEFGELLIAPPPPVKKKKIYTYPMGTLRKIYLPHMENMQVGNVATVPVPKDYRPGALQSAMTAHACNNWGAGSAMSHYDKEKNTIELMRTK